jgi:hypothetical protein
MVKNVNFYWIYKLQDEKYNLWKYEEKIKKNRI